MDADRFDSLARSLGAPTSRRAALGATVAGGLLSALGLTRGLPDARAAQGGTCVVAFAANVLQGPSRAKPLTPNAARAGEVRGELSFALSPTGNLDNATLTLPDGTRLPVVGQATGHSLQLRIEVAPRMALVAVGVGVQEIAACRGAIDGVAAGPDIGDLGDWHAAGVQQARGGADQANADSSGRGGRQSGTGDATEGGRGAGNRTDRAGRDPAPTQSQGTGGNPASSSSPPASGSDAPSCPSGQTLCDADGECHDLNIEASNCGACGNRCPSQSCRNGRCLSEEDTDQAGGLDLDCEEGSVFCDLEDGYCADLLTNSLNCGGCGTACPAESPVCSGGNCFEAQDIEGQQDQGGCGGLMILCNGKCVDPATDGDNCGSCGTVCPYSPEIYNCEGGVCVPPSCEPLTKCGLLCVDPRTDSLHCGVCGNACAEDTICQEGACNATGGGGCLTGSGLTYCSGACVDLNTDPVNCGACGGDCGGGVCVGGVCTYCLNTMLNCAGVCVEASSDSAHCGGCGIVCAAGEACQGGACIPTGGGGCIAGLTECAGTCVDVNTDPVHCGGCGVVCQPATTCLYGECYSNAPAAPAAPVCLTGQANCGGVCIDVVSDPANCGNCGVACAAGQSCFLGGCVSPDVISGL